MRVVKGLAIAAVMAVLTAGVTVLGNALSRADSSPEGACAQSC